MRFLSGTALLALLGTAAARDVRIVWREKGGPPSLVGAGFWTKPNGPSQPKIELSIEKDGKPGKDHDFYAGPMTGVRNEPGWTPHCHLEGKLDEGVDSVTFTFQDSNNFLDPCGPQHGITVVCDGRHAVCAPFT